MSSADRREKTIHSLIEDCKKSVVVRSLKKQKKAPKRKPCRLLGAENGKRVSFQGENLSSRRKKL